ncbi:unnamed protein product, partial [Symbiodinium sp. KB8]
MKDIGFHRFGLQWLLLLGLVKVAAAVVAVEPLSTTHFLSSLYTANIDPYEVPEKEGDQWCYFSPMTSGYAVAVFNIADGNDSVRVENTGDFSYTLQSILVQPPLCMVHVTTTIDTTIYLFNMALGDLVWSRTGDASAAYLDSELGFVAVVHFHENVLKNATLSTIVTDATAQETTLKTIGPVDQSISYYHSPLLLLAPSPGTNIIRAYDMSAGASWNANLQNGFSDSLEFTPFVMWVVSNSDLLYFGYSSGNKLWTGTGWAISTSFLGVFGSTLLYSHSGGSTVEAVDPFTGSVVFSLPGSSSDSFGVADTLLAFYQDSTSSLVVVDTTGTSQYSNASVGEIFVVGALEDGASLVVFYFTPSEDSGVLVLNTATSPFQWRWREPVTPFGASAGAVYAYDTSNGNIVAFNTHTGTKRWSIGSGSYDSIVAP